MLDKEIAAIAYFVKPIVNKQYFDIVPNDLATPSIFFPEPEVEGDDDCLGGHKLLYTMYAKVFAETTVKSSALAKEIVKKIMYYKRKIPLYDSEGVLTSKCFRLKDCKSRNIEIGVSQIQLSWYVHEDYYSVEGTPSRMIVVEGLATSVEMEEDDGNEQSEQQAE